MIPRTQDRAIRQRVTVSTLLPIGLLGLAALVVLMQVNKIRETARSVEHTEEVIGACADFERIARQHKSSVLRRLLGMDTRDEELSTRSRAAQAILSLEHQLADNESQLDQVRELNTRFGTWLEFAASLRHEPGQRDVNTKDIDQIEHLFDPLVDIVLSLEREEKRLRGKRTEEFNAATLLTVAGALPALFLLVVVVGLYHRSQMLRLTKDFGEALGGQEAAKADLAEQNWIREQLALLIGTTRDDPGLSVLGAKLLSCLAQATGAVLGAFYVWEERDGKWRRSSQRAVALDLRYEYGEGEGLLGQAARETSVTIVKGVDDEFFFVQSGTGQGSTREISIVPCHHDGQVLAIVELGFLELPTQRARKFLDVCGEAMGIAVSVTKRRLGQRELLLESKRQAEALQTQQEELRVTNEELASQSEALRSAHAQLEERKEELEASNSDLVRQRDAVAAAREDLALRALELRRANRYKSEFLASMSHELRTPLNSCLILSRSLADNKGGNLTEEQIKFAETIYASGTDLLELINAVLDLSKIEAGAIEIVNEEVTLGALVKPVMRVMEPIAAERKLDFVVNLPDAEVIIETDMLRVQQVLKNLLSNACKFTAEGSVTLTLDVAEKVVSFTVKDTGIGIAEDQLESIFEAFRQADGTESRKFGGTGLGLTISRDLAKRLGGDIDVRSKPGQGSQFTLTIPRFRDHKSELASVPENVALPSRPVAIPAPPPPVKAGQEVLVVRREHDSGVEVDQIIESWGFDVMRVQSNRQAILELTRQRFAAVLALQGEDISELVAEARRHNVPCHVMQAKVRQEQLSPGILRHLRKPADETELRRALKSLFERTNPSDGVLLVEDDEGSRGALEVLLQENNVRVTSTATLEGALKALREASFACVILDLQLADGRGEDLLRTISNDDTYSFPHVIVYTGSELTPEKEQELLRFSDAVILKGVRSDERLLDELSLFLHDVNERTPSRHNRDKRPSTRPKNGTSSLKNRHVLLVEDDVRNVYALTSVLEKEGVQVEVARNGREALTKLQGRPGLELVLMDIMMPEMNGFEAMQAIRSSHQAWRSVPIIALTAKAMRDDRKACLDAGANDYVTKPIDVERLLSLMRIWLDRT